MQGLISEGSPYLGFLYAGLMIKDGELKVLEFNCRFGDPETQPIMMRLESDFIELLESSFDDDISNFPIAWKKEAALGVVMSSKGYPQDYEIGYEIKNNNIENKNMNEKVFHSGTANNNDKIVTSGGRVLCVTALGKTIEAAKNNSYSLVKNISWDGCYYRNDIGNKAIK